MNRVNKGQNYENKLAKELKELGYEITKYPRTRFGQKDIFNLFDFSGFNYKNGHLVLIQATCSKKKKDFEDRVKKCQAFRPKQITIKVVSPNKTTETFSGAIVEIIGTVK
jgi:hypothetical protein